MNKEIEILIEKYLDGSISNEELTILMQWGKESEENEKLLHEQKAIWTISNITNSALDSNEKKSWDRITSRMNEQKGKQLQRSANLQILIRAASILLLIGLGIVGGYFISNKANKHSIALAKNQQMPDTLVFSSKTSSKSIVNLPDGSTVWLNSDSELKFLSDFKQKREVFLTGEAYFDVQKSEIEGNYFYVHTPEIKIRVLGTEFNVKSYPEEGTIETTLEEGKIDLLKKNKEAEDSYLTSLLPNQRATFIKNKGKIYLKEFVEENKSTPEKLERKEELLISEKVETSLYTSWKDGHLIIDAEPFESFVAQLERWYDVNINIINKKVSKLHFTANFKNETLEQALEALQIAHPFSYTFDVDKNIITIE